MASTYSTSLKLELIGSGDQSGTWGTTTNTNLGTLIEQAIVGQSTITMANADYTLSDYNGASDEARNAVIIISGSQNASYSVICPAQQKLYLITNSLSSSATAYFKPSGGSALTIANGNTVLAYCTGSAMVALSYVATAGTATTAAGLTGTPNITVGTVNGTTITASVQFTGSGAGLTGTAPSLTAGSVTLAPVSTNIAGGSANVIPYQTGSSTTSFLPAGTSGYVLQSNGSGLAPSWATGVPAGSVITTNYTIQESGGKLIFKYGSTTIASLDSSGNFITLGSETAGGTP
jgi:hypothetical protein